MSRQHTSDKDPIAFAWYWQHLREHVLTYPQRTDVLRTVLDADFSMATTGHVAKVATQQLRQTGIDTEIDQGDLNRYLGHLTRTGALFRVPKLSNDDHYLIAPNPLVQDWLREIDFTGEGPSRYPGTVASDAVRYLGRNFRTEGVSSGNRPSYSTTPLEAVLDGLCRRSGEWPTGIEVALGSLERVEASTDVLSDPVLDLGTTLPGDDDEWGDGRRVHDYAVAFELEGFETEPSGATRHGLRTLLVMLVGISITGYFVDTDGDFGARASDNEVFQRVREFVGPSDPDVDRARRRIGQDVSYDESRGRVLAGLYFRRKMPTKDNGD